MWLGENCEGVTFYEGKVWHMRKSPRKNSFVYPLRFAVIDLDNAPRWFASSGQAKDHLTADEVRARCGTDGPVRLLASPWAFGYVQNPIAVYYAYRKPKAGEEEDDKKSAKEKVGSKESKEKEGSKAAAAAPTYSAETLEQVCSTNNLVRGNTH